MTFDSQKQDQTVKPSSALDSLRRSTARASFIEAPDADGYWYAVWLDDEGAIELSLAAGVEVPSGIVYAGECPTQSLRRHLAHSNIGSLTLMMSLAALLRSRWSLEATNGNRLHEPGRHKVLTWMQAHLTVTWTEATPDLTFREVLEALDPPLGLKGFAPERTALRTLVREQRRLLR